MDALRLPQLAKFSQRNSSYNTQNARSHPRPPRQGKFVRCAKPTATATLATSAADSSTVDVSGACVKPVFRSTPRIREGDEDRREVRVLFLSEGNVCRSVIAETVFRNLVEARGLSNVIECESKGVRDYNVGESPSPVAAQVAAQCGILLDPSHCARLVQPAEDITHFDLLVVMDKFNAADVLKEVSVFDTVDPSAKYSSKVRRLGDFCRSREVGDVDDPLYGNMGGPEELELLSDALTDIEESCQGLLEQLELIVKPPEGHDGDFHPRHAVRSWLCEMEALEWLVPPMLQKRV